MKKRMNKDMKPSEDEKRWGFIVVPVPVEWKSVWKGTTEWCGASGLTWWSISLILFVFLTLLLDKTSDKCIVMWQFLFSIIIFCFLKLSHSHCLCCVHCHSPPPTPPSISTSREAGAENWGTEGCQTLASNTVHTKCLCSRISTYAVLAQQAKDPVSHRCIAWCTLWVFGWVGGGLTRQVPAGAKSVSWQGFVFKI